MFYKNARIFTGDFQFHTGAFEVTNGLFGRILPEDVPEDAIDLQGATVIPGLVEVHSHGNSGADFSDGSYEGLKAMAKYYAACGATSFAPTSMTLPYDILSKAFATAKQLKDEAPEGHARIMGIQMEGPYFSYKKRGAQNPDYLMTPDFEGFKELYDACGGMIRIVDIAPELPVPQNLWPEPASFAQSPSPTPTAATTMPAPRWMPVSLIWSICTMPCPPSTTAIPV